MFDFPPWFWYNLIGVKLNGGGELTRIVYFDGEKIEYTFVQKNIKNINLRIKSDGSITVSAPHCIFPTDVDRFVVSNGGKISEARKKYSKIEETDGKFGELCDGDTFYILGERKKIVNKPSRQYKATLFGEYLVIEYIDDDMDKKKKAIVELLEGICRNEAGSATKKFEAFFANEGVAMPELTFRKMRSRWGSCMPSQKRICLNKLLGCVDICGIEYVVLHELAHLVHPNHSGDFYKLIWKYMPDYRRRKKELSKYAIFLLNF